MTTLAAPSIEPARLARFAVAPTALGIASGLGAVVMWGLDLACARAGVNDGLEAIDFVALRYATAGAIMLP